MIITIDGQIATGKSTIAKALAREIGYIYMDTGAMYRCLTYAALKKKVNVDNPEELAQFLSDFKFVMRIMHETKHYFVDNEDVTDKIRLSEVTAEVSKISAIKEVREKLVTLQRELAEGVNCIVEGRDMGSVVFPEAGLKIFLTGRPEIRAKRRFDELKAKFPEETANLTLEQTLKEINERDHYDMNRPISPLKQPTGAFVVDTSDKTIQDVVLEILEHRDSLKTRRSKS